MVYYVVVVGVDVILGIICLPWVRIGWGNLRKVLVEVFHGQGEGGVREKIREVKRAPK